MSFPGDRGNQHRDPWMLPETKPSGLFWIFWRGLVIFEEKIGVQSTGQTFINLKKITKKQWWNNDVATELNSFFEPSWRKISKNGMRGWGRSNGQLFLKIPLPTKTSCHGSKLFAWTDKRFSSGWDSAKKLICIKVITLRRKKKQKYVHNVII